MARMDPNEVAAEIQRIRLLGVDEVRALYRTTFRSAPPKALTKDLVARMIAYRIQEQAFGGLDRATLKLLDAYARGKNSTVDGLRRLKAGTVLVREYQGIQHTVTVVPDGFLWREQTYQSLSGIARAITGMTWNGPRFFGLRVTGNRSEAGKMGKTESSPPRTSKRGRETASAATAEPGNGPEAPQ